MSREGVGGCDELILSLTLRGPAPSVEVAEAGVCCEPAPAAADAAVPFVGPGVATDGSEAAAKDEERLTLILRRGLGGGAGMALPSPGADMAARARCAGVCVCDVWFRSLRCVLRAAAAMAEGLQRR